MTSGSASDGDTVGCPRCGRPVSGRSLVALCSRCLFVALGEESMVSDVADDACAASPSSRILGDYELHGEIARGGMGVVFRARQRSLGRWVAVKLARDGGFALRDHLRRFRTEVEAAATLDHPHIVPIYEVGEHEGCPFFSMKLLEGGTVMARFADRPTDPRLAANITAKVGRALHFAHQRGVLHRDVKPNNILLDSAGEPFLTDFGLARLMEEDSTVTRTVAVMGTPAYMAPEQARGGMKTVTTAVDVYGLGAVLYELLTGQPPHRGDSPIDIVRKVLEEEPRRPSQINRAIDRDLEVICLRCLEKEPARRYGSALAVSEDLERWLRGEPIQARPISSFERLAKWVRRRPAIASLSGLALMAGLAAVAVTTAFKLRLNEVQRREALSHRQSAIRLLVAEANHHIEDGDGCMALPMLVGALERAQGWPDHELAQRERLGALLRMSPRLRRLWVLDAPVLHATRDGEGRRLAFGTAAGLATIRDSETGEAIGPPLRHTGAVMRVLFSPDSQLLAASEEACCVRLWDLRSSTPLGAPLQWRSSWYDPAVFGAAGSVLAVPGDSNVLFHPVDGSGAPDARMPAIPGIQALAVDPSGTQFFVGGEDGKGRFWDRPRARWIGPELPHPARLRAAFFVLAGRFLVTIAEDWRARVWNAETGELIRVTEAHESDILSWAATQDGHRFATAGYDNAVRVWETTNTGPALTLVRHASAAGAVDLSADGRWMVTGTYGGAARLWELPTGRPATPNLPHSAGVSTVLLEPSGQRFITASYGGEARQWQLPPDGGTLKSWKSIETPVLARFDADGSNVVVVARDGEARRLAMQGGPEASWRIHHGSPIASADLAADGRILALGGTDGTVSIWRIGHMDPLRRMRVDEHTVTQIRLSADARQWIALCNDRRVTAGSIEDSPPLPHRFWHNDGIHWIRFSPDGGTVGIAGFSGLGALWNPAHGTERFRFPGLARFVGRIEFSPDGRQVLTTDWDWDNYARAGRRWDARTGEELLPPLAHTDGVRCGRYSPDGRFIATGGEDFRARVWFAETGRPATPFLDHRGLVAEVAFSPKSDRVATASWDQTARVWSIADGQPLTPPLLHDGRVLQVEFSPDGRSLLTVAEDRTVRVWDLSPIDWPLNDLRDVAELLAGHRLEKDSDRVPLTTAELEQRWKAIQSRHPDYLQGF